MPNASFTKHFDTHTSYQGGGGGGFGWTPCYLKNRCPHEREIMQGIRNTFERPLFLTIFSKE